MERQLVLVPPKFKVEQIENIQTQYDSELSNSTKNHFRDAETSEEPVFVFH
jgi:hypothetical protein